jgi:hypothetical protein
LDVLLGWAAAFLAPHGVCLFPKGRGVEDELTAAAARWQMQIHGTTSRTDPSATILRISEIGPVKNKP